MQESTTNSTKAAEESKVRGEESKKERPDQQIVDFEERLKEPMLPDFKLAATKVEKKFPGVI